MLANSENEATDGNVESDQETTANTEVEIGTDIEFADSNDFDLPLDVEPVTESVLLDKPLEADVESIDEATTETVVDTDFPDINIDVVDAIELADIEELIESPELNTHDGLSTLDADSVETNADVDEVFDAEIDIDLESIDEDLSVPELEITELVQAAESEEQDEPEPVVSQASSDDAIAISEMSDEEFDAETLAIFREEATDLLEAMDNSLHEQGERESSQIISELLRNLHTIKGGARLAGQFEIGDMAHDFESYLERLEPLSVDKAKFADIHTRQDQLVALFSGESISTNEDDAVTDTNVNEAVDAETVVESNENNLVETIPEISEDKDIQNNVVELALPQELVPVEQETPKPVEKQAQLAVDTQAQSQELVRVSGRLLENLVNLAGESSISRSRIEEQINEITFFVDELDGTLDRLKEQLRRLEIENEAQVIFRQEQVESLGLQEFDPLEMDRYSALQQLTRSLSESAFDVSDIKATIFDKVRDIETLLIQQGRVNTDLQEGLMKTTMVPFDRIVPRLRRIVRQVSRDLDKSVVLSLDEAEGNLDRNVLESMLPPLEHMLRNAVDHGIESSEERLRKGKTTHGLLRLSVMRDGGDIVIKLSDDGRGIDHDRVRQKAIARGLLEEDDLIDERELTRILTSPGFSTAAEVTQISGRGVGLDVVAMGINKLGGSLAIESTKDIGSHFIVRLPFTASVNRALIVKNGTEQYALPLTTIDNVVRLPVGDLSKYIGENAVPYHYRGIDYQMRNISELVDKALRHYSNDANDNYVPIVLMRGEDNPLAVQVDSVLGSREVVVKSIGGQFGDVPGISGATIMGDGSVVVILDLINLHRTEMRKIAEGEAVRILKAVEDKQSKPLVMVVDDSVTVRKVSSRFLERNGMRVLLAKDGVEAMQLLLDAKPEVMLLDVEMPRMDGFEVASRVKRSEEYNEITIVMITSRTGQKHRERALELGVDHYLGKPYQEHELLEILEDTIDIHKD